MTGLTPTGRHRSGGPALQNIPIREYKGSFAQFMIQMRSAQETALMDWNRLLAEGYVEVSPGFLRHPETGTEVHNG